MAIRPRDTSVEAWRFRQGILAGMTAEARLLAALEVSDSVREIQIAGLLARHPAWSRTDAVRELVLIDTGVDLGVRA